jgi:hypothetical protein
MEDKIKSDTETFGVHAGGAAAVAAAVAPPTRDDGSSSSSSSSSGDDAGSEYSDVAIASNIDLHEEGIGPNYDAITASNIEYDEDNDDDVNAAPGHLRCLSHIPDARLRGMMAGGRTHGSDGKLNELLLTSGGSSGASAMMAAAGRRSRSSSRTRPMGGSLTGCGGGGGSLGGGGQQVTQGSACSSRSSSPMSSIRGGTTLGSHSAHFVGGGGGGGSTTGHSVGCHSRHSSLDGMFDPDLLLDRLGFIDLDPPLPHEIRCGPLGAPGMFDGKSNNSGGLTPVNERLSEETLDDCHAFNDLLYCGGGIAGGGGGGVNHGSGGGMSSTISMPSVAHSSLSGIRSGDNMSVGSLSVGSFKGGQSRGGSLAGGSLMGDGENSVLLGTLDEEGEDESQ